MYFLQNKTDFLFVLDRFKFSGEDHVVRYLEILMIFSYYVEPRLRGKTRITRES